MKVFKVYHRSSHHASVSGYNQLTQYGEDSLISATPKYIPYRVAKYISQRTDQDAGIYDSNSVFKDINLTIKILKYGIRAKTIHYLNAERDIRIASILKPFLHKTKVCATFHKPPSILKTQISNTTYLSKLDGAIVVGSNQVSFIKETFGLDNVKYIPHGVDVHFFKPSKDVFKSSNKPNILFVGQHLRDFDTLNKVIKVFENKNQSIIFNIVLREDFRNNVCDSPIVNVFSNIDDYKLLELYQKATLLYLPLKDSTACNSILEAMACGLPIITTKVGGNSDYLSNTSSILLDPATVQDSVTVITKVINSQELQKHMSLSVRKKAVDCFSWKIISKSISQFYHELHNK
ncbi:MAG: glycosyltransferase family 1 protein [Winogradskyella sp.]|uniref:glycosyltransferase family 4 protein n=1 Tax=Winogradskyella sp. TaxID=1883156 RepID=UPI000F3DE800|nr:glycosyltransferase family 4 protein [Winogradskyella sp.]RNC86888.1 MAG: glycosyltransferase family 1 protein [Winogradskyella sp.]